MMMTLSFSVAHHLELVFFPSQHRLFDQRFVHRREIQTARQDFHQFFAVVSDAAARPAESERRDE